MAGSDKDKMADEALSIRLLAGFDVDSGHTSFLKHNSFEERNARAALARVVRDQMRGFSGELLALAIDPRTASTWPNMKPARKIRFESPGRGKGSTLMRDKLIVDFIRRQRFNGTTDKIDPHLAAAEKHFGLKRSRVHQIWNAYEKMLKTASAK